MPPFSQGDARDVRLKLLAMKADAKFNKEDSADDGFFAGENTSEGKW